MAVVNIYDLIIVGGGPIGMACAIEAKKKNLNYLVIEKGSLVNSLYNYPLYMTFFSTSEKLEIGNLPFVNTSFKPGRKEALEYYRRVYQHYELNINFYERVFSINSEDELRTVISSKTEYKTKNVIIATGFYDLPMLLNIPGENLSKVTHYFKEAHPYTGKKIVVVGASNSSVDVALECWRKGASEVSMVIRGGEISDHVKYWIKPDIENRIEEGSIKAYFHSNLKEIKEKSVVIETADGTIEIENDFVLAMTGYRPDIEFLSSVGIEFSNDGKFIPVFNPETMETNVEGVYLAGVVCGGLETHNWIIENSRVHAEMILEDISNSK
ncbi:MAG: YpdA family putative bacillithiol disulfide reductase [Flavobacteriia bacterium]|nr:YpdA family putative bacillithiol disulfide reductase [Flavobacteriia bacterium]